MNEYLKEIATLCKVDKTLTTHVARHTFATSVTLMNHVSIESVSKMLGHTNLAMTQKYARILDQKINGEMLANVAAKY
jgi:site-specific recombinase XerD